MSMGIFLGVGSNLGDRLRNLEEAKILLSLRVVRESSIYETEPVGFLDQPWFLNAVWEIDTEHSPPELLMHCQKVERTMGRKREIAKGPRVIDLDILFYGDRVVNEPELMIPHPAIPERRFVLVPMNDIAPGFIHPVLMQSVSQLLTACPDPSVVKPFETAGGR